MEEEKQELNEKKNLNNKKTLVVASIMLVLILGVLVYRIFFEKSDKSKTDDKNTPTPVVTALTNDEAINIAKEMLERANFFNFVGNIYSDENEKCSEEGQCSNYYYYDTLSNFKIKFYNIYSSKLEYKDVFIEYNIEIDKLSKGNLGNVPEYTIKNDKVYVSRCTIGSGDYVRMDNFVVDNKTNDTIKIKYDVIGKDDNIENSEEYEDEETMTLVKENGSWKIINATIVDQCNGVYEVGK